MLLPMLMKSTELPANRVSISHFNTDKIVPDLREEAWRENMGVLFDMNLPAAGQPDKVVSARIEACSFGDTVFGVTHANGRLFERSPSRVARDDMDHILVQVFIKGGGVTEHNNQICKGDMLVIDLGRPHRMLNSDFENLTLVLPRDIYPQLSDTLAQLHGQKLPFTNPVIRLMSEHLLALWRQVGDMSMEQATGSLHDSLELLYRSISREGLSGDIQPGASIQLSKLVRRYIESHMSDELNPNELAVKFGLSRSQLYRMFDADGGVARYIWERRLNSAMRMLSLPQYRHLPIIAIACEVGFTSEAHFSRVFKTRFGLPPGQARAKMMEDQGAHNVTDTTSPGYGTDLANWIRRL